MSEVATITDWDKLPVLLTPAHMESLYSVSSKTLSRYAKCGQVPPPVGERKARRWNRELVRQHLERRQRM